MSTKIFLCFYLQCQAATPRRTEFGGLGPVTDKESLSMPRTPYTVGVYVGIFFQYGQVMESKNSGRSRSERESIYLLWYSRFSIPNYSQAYATEVL